MHLIKHFIINLVIGGMILLILPELGLQFFILLVASGVLIDLDHLVYFGIYGFKGLKKDFRKSNPHFFMFHTFEFILILIIGSFFFFWVFPVFLGVAIHLISDIFEYYRKDRRDWIAYWSIIYQICKKF